jgi:hypothetical protein
MPSAEYHKIQIIQTQEKLDMVYQSINNFTMPYKYFKKLNILPLDIVEGEMDKYFDIITLLLENFSEAKHIDYRIQFMYEGGIGNGIHQDLIPNLLKYYNNFPLELFSNYKISDYIMNNYKKYKEANVITPIIDNEIREELDNILTNKIISAKKNTIKYHTHQIIEEEGKTLYKIPIDKLPPNSKLTFDGGNLHCMNYNNIYIIKVCNKIIKYKNFKDDTKCSQVKKDVLLWYMDNDSYKLKDMDTKKYYTYENGIVKLED